MAASRASRSGSSMTKNGGTPCDRRSHAMSAISPPMPAGLARLQRREQLLELRGQAADLDIAHFAGALRRALMANPFHVFATLGGLAHLLSRDERLLPVGIDRGLRIEQERDPGEGDRGVIGARRAKDPPLQQPQYIKSAGRPHGR